MINIVGRSGTRYHDDVKEKGSVGPGRRHAHRKGRCHIMQESAALVPVVDSQNVPSTAQSSVFALYGKEVFPQLSQEAAGSA